jgi:hypothetical protein
MTNAASFDPTTRCQNCGGTKKEHGTKAKAFRCPTKLTESYWTPWASNEEYEAVAKASADRAAAAVATAKTARECPFCHVAHKTTVPTIHLNGTSAGELREQLDRAVDGLRGARECVVMAGPNGRDYYPQAAGATEAAMGAHERRLRHLDDMLAELEEQREHVQAVLDFEAERRAR